MSRTIDDLVFQVAKSQGVEYVPIPHVPGAYLLRMTEDQAVDLASGFVPSAVKAQIIEMLDAHREDERRAARPIPRKKDVRVSKP